MTGIAQKIIAASLVAVLLSACSPIGTLNAVSAGGTKHAVTRDVSYGPLARQRLDIYRPSASSPPAGWPLVVFFYGGSWSSGQRDDYAFVGAALADRGVVTLVADYRLYPEVRYPDFMKDSAKALSYGLDEAKRLGADPKRVFVMGHSAGGYNAAMLALDPRWLAATKHSPGQLAGWIGLSGPYDFLPSSDPELRSIFHHPDYPPGSQPIDHMRRGTPPTHVPRSAARRQGGQLSAQHASAGRGPAESGRAGDPQDVCTRQPRDASGRLRLAASVGGQHPRRRAQLHRNDAASLTA